MAGKVIKYRIDLIIRVIDTATGTVIPEKDHEVMKDGKPIEVFVKENGQYILMNMGRENFKLTVRIKGFYEQTLDVDYEKIDEHFPMIDMYMVPDEYYATQQACVVLEGNTPGIERIDAVLLNNPIIRVKEYDARKKTITVFNPHNKMIDTVHYAVLNSDGSSYEEFSVLETESETTMKIDHALENEVQVNFPLSRIIYGKVSDDGDYLLRVRDDITGGRYLVRQVVQGKETFSLWEP